MALLVKPPRATCAHPTRPAFGPEGQCRECVKWARLDGTDVRGCPPQPAAVVGVEQYASAEAPATCPKCDAGPPSWEPAPGALYVRCLRCGRDWYRLGTRAVAPPVAGRGPRL